LQDSQLEKLVGVVSYYNPSRLYIFDFFFLIFPWLMYLKNSILKETLRLISAVPGKLSRIVPRRKRFFKYISPGTIEGTGGSSKYNIFFGFFCSNL
jgi:hypothetical protein